MAMDMATSTRHLLHGIYVGISGCSTIAAAAAWVGVEEQPPPHSIRRLDDIPRA